MDPETELLASQSEHVMPTDYEPFSADVPQEYHEAAEEARGDIGDHAIPAFLLTKFTLYETKNTIYIVGSNARETRFRVLSIDLTVSKDELKISEQIKVHNRKEIMDVLASLEEDNKDSGGLSKRLTALGILGFIRFSEGYYMCVVTKRSVVALLGGHYVYHIDKTEWVPLVHSGTYRKPDRRSEEARYMATLANLDLSKTFYFSYTYDITHTLQHNLTREKKKALGKAVEDTIDEHNEMFVWNNGLLQPILRSFENAMDWCVPIIHGFIDQAKISVCGRSVLVAIIARRSHYFAGARFLKRGVNDQGFVANEVETEQVVTDLMTSSFHDPKDGLFNNPRFTSYVQHRGSIPLYWSQDVSNMSPKPPIELNCVDPFFSSAALHFNDMFARYGSPILVLNLIKARERVPRESKLLKEFEQCIDYLNRQLPEESRILYTSWDMSRASKGRNQEVIDFLENYADDTLLKTGFFKNGKNLSGMEIQDGICRTNCIDCLDRTNAAQFVIGKRALGYQLHALGIIDDPAHLEYDSDAVNLLTEMFHDHGDTLALQYGGSHLVNTMETYRKINQWTSHSRDMIESIRRFYNNSFVDSQRQDAINLFLGNYVWEQGQPMLWDLPTDYYLHNSFIGGKRDRRSYVKWWIPRDIEPKRIRIERDVKRLEEENQADEQSLTPHRAFHDNYWNEYYKPRALSSFQLAFAFNMNSTLRYSPIGDTSVGPFKSRKRRNMEMTSRYPPNARPAPLIPNGITGAPMASFLMKTTAQTEGRPAAVNEDHRDQGRKLSTQLGSYSLHAATPTNEVGETAEEMNEKKQFVDLMTMKEPDVELYEKLTELDLNFEDKSKQSEYQQFEEKSPDIDFYNSWATVPNI